MVGTQEIGPDFTLTGTRGDDIREFTLSEFAAGRPVILVFYVYDFSPVCSTQVCEIDDMEMLTFNDEIGILGISPDGPYSHKEFIQQHDLSYPLLTDENKEVYEQYGMIGRAADGTRAHKRGVVLLGADRTVRYRWVAADNWEEWTVQPLVEAHEIGTDLLDAGIETDPGP